MFPSKYCKTCISVCARMCAYRNNHDVVLQEDLVSFWGGGTISTLSNDLEQTKRTHHMTATKLPSCEFK